jgi:hypothetical protein
MRIVRLFAIFLALALLAAPALAAEFSATQVITTPQQTVSGKFYIKENKLRIEMDSQHYIIDSEKGTSIVVIPERKSYMAYPAIPSMISIDKMQAELEKTAEKKVLGTETINGYETEKAVFTFKDPAKGTMTQWYSPDLGFPIRVQYDTPGEGMSSEEYRDITEGGVSDELFRVPQDYTRIAVPQQPGQPQQRPAQ